MAREWTRNGLPLAMPKRHILAGFSYLAAATAGRNMTRAAAIAVATGIVMMVLLTVVPAYEAAHRWVDAEGVRLHAVEGGRSSGPTLVLLAGFPQTWWAWHKAMPRLAERFHVIAIDLPGQGHSDRPPWGYDTHALASRVQAALTALNVPKYCH